MLLACKALQYFSMPLWQHLGYHAPHAGRITSTKFLVGWIMFSENVQLVLSHPNACRAVDLGSIRWETV